MYEDKTAEWEEEFTNRNQTKLKCPIKAIDESLNTIDLDFIEPIICSPRLNTKKVDKNNISVIDLSKNSRKNKKDKNKLF